MSMYAFMCDDVHIMCLRERERERNKMIIEKEKAKKKKKKLFSLINLLIMTLLSKQKKKTVSAKENMVLE